MNRNANSADVLLDQAEKLESLQYGEYMQGLPKLILSLILKKVFKFDQFLSNLIHFRREKH